MKLLMSVIMFTASITLSSFATAQVSGAPGSPEPGGMSEIVCSANDAEICSQLLYRSTISTATEGQFQVIVKVPENAPIENFKVDLWMQMGHHGHGSSPVDITEDANGYYLVKNAWFVMRGKWDVRIDFTVNGQAHHIEIPVYVAK